MHILNNDLKSCNGFGVKPILKGYLMMADFSFYYIDHFFFKSLEEFTDKLNRGDAITYNTIQSKYYKLDRYFIMNQININKINYIEKKCRINMTKYKKLYLKNKN